jgi:hypothetical protein
MCFYDQFIFSCGDYKWGHFRHHCNRWYRTGETCGIKLIMLALRVESKCKRCEKLDTTFRRRQAEATKIASWKQNRRNVPLPLAYCHVESRSNLSEPGVPSIVSAGGDTLQVGNAVGFATYRDVQGISGSGYAPPNRGQRNRMTAFGALGDLAGQDNAPFLRDQQGNGEDLGPEHRSLRSDSVIAAYQSTKTWCDCVYPSPRFLQECLSALLRAASREAGNPASAPQQDNIGPNPQKNTTPHRLYQRMVRARKISTLMKETKLRSGPAPRTPPMCKVTAT